MLEKIVFRNHINEEIQFGEGGLYLNNTDLHSYGWDYISRNDKISFFTRTIVEKSLPVRVKCNTRDEGYQLMNDLMEKADKDILSREPGRLIAGDYYLNCYLCRNNKDRYDLQNGIFYAELTVVTDQPSWVKETTQKFNPQSGGSGQNLDYPFDFPYDFASPSASTEIQNGFSDSDFRMVIYGEVTNPAITIGNHAYQVTGHVDDGEYLVIDSRDKTVMLVEGDGTLVNWFSKRNRDNYIFQKIPSGTSNVLWSGEFDFDITLFEERSEPKWT